ncbi:MAG: hypothetical protein QXU82_02390 [Candidatus Aenigmatarchaeota archaeon]
MNNAEAKKAAYDYYWPAEEPPMNSWTQVYAAMGCDPGYSATPIPRQALLDDFD